MIEDDVVGENHADRQDEATPSPSAPGPDPQGQGDQREGDTGHRQGEPAVQLHEHLDEGLLASPFALRIGVVGLELVDKGEQLGCGSLAHPKADLDRAPLVRHQFDQLGLVHVAPVGRRVARRELMGRDVFQEEPR